MRVHSIILPWNLKDPGDGSTARLLPVLYPEASKFLAAHPSRPFPPQLVWLTILKTLNNASLRHYYYHL